MKFLFYKALHSYIKLRLPQIFNNW